MNNDLLQYLQQDSIGKVIARGLADVYTHKPAAPVKYLAAWLKNYSRNQQVVHDLGKEQALKVDNLKTFNSNAVRDAKQAEEEEKRHQAHDSKIANFKKLIVDHEYQEELLREWLP